VDARGSFICPNSVSVHFIKFVVTPRGDSDVLMKHRYCVLQTNMIKVPCDHI